MTGSSANPEKSNPTEEEKKRAVEEIENQEEFDPPKDEKGNWLCPVCEDVIVNGPGNLCSYCADN